MKTTEVLKLSPFDRLRYWITERESIRLKKEAGEPPPWTDDPILQTYRFCNVRRMDDKVSRWLLENWYGPHRNHPMMLVNAALARHFNLPAALNAIGFQERWQPERIKSTIRAMKANGENVFNGAYMVRGIGTADKTEMVVDMVCAPLVVNRPKIDGSTMERAVEALLPYWGFSTFMAGQVVADLRWGISGSWKDRHDWAPIGPGSLRGMNRLHGRELTQPLKQDQFTEELGNLMERLDVGLHSSITSRMEAIDFQNCLCEFDKYTRALLGEGRPKQLYRT